jgi:hypothetical protein
MHSSAVASVVMSVFNGERFRIEYLRTVLISTHFIEAAYRVRLKRYSFCFPACAYNRELQKEQNAGDVKEADPHPAGTEHGYG